MLIRLLKKLNDALNSANKFESILTYKLRANYLLDLALQAKEAITQPKKKDEVELIVSLTTYSKRIFDVHLVIESIAQQTVKPNRLILWLDEDEFSLDSIPLILHKQIARGLEVRFCPNYRSYKKLIPTLKAFPEANIITIDDDILYPYDMIEGLLKAHHIFPDIIVANRCHTMTFDNKGKLRPYNQWDYETLDERPSLKHLATGVGGILYPTGALNSECLNENNRDILALNADDIWFKGMSLLNNVETKKVHDPRCFDSRYLSIKSSQDIALSLKNVGNAENDKQINLVFKHYRLLDKFK